MSLNDVKINDFENGDRVDEIRNNIGALQDLSTEEEYLKSEYDILNFSQRAKELEKELVALDRFKQNDSYYLNQKVEFLRIIFFFFLQKERKLS